MRSIAALATLLVLAGPVAADDDLAHTREVLRRHAESSRRVQTTLGVVTIATSAALGVGGYYVLSNVSEGGGLVDLSELERALGYTMVGLGGLGILSGTILLIATNEFERMADEVNGEQDARYARTEIAHKAATAHRRRVIIRGVGLTLLGIGALGATVAIAGGDRWDSTQTDLLGAGIAFGIWGTGMVGASFVSSRWEDIHDDLQVQRAPVTAGLVPVRGGAILGIAGGF